MISVMGTSLNSFALALKFNVAASCIRMQSTRHAKPVREVTKVASSPARSHQDFLTFTGAADFHDQGSIEAQAVKVSKKHPPVDIALSRRKMIVVMTVIVAGMDHPEMSGQLVNYPGKIFPQVRMSCVKADTDLSRIE